MGLEEVLSVLKSGKCHNNKLNWVKLDYGESRDYIMSKCKTCDVIYQKKDEQLFFSEPQKNSYSCGKCGSESQSGLVKYEFFIEMDGDLFGPDRYLELALHCVNDECEWGPKQVIIKHIQKFSKD